MIRHVIDEGGAIPLDQRYIEIATELKKRNGLLPFEVFPDELRFAEYTVGEVILGDLSVRLRPRNSAFSIRSYFEIVNFLNELEDDLISANQEDGEDWQFNLRSLSLSFSEVIERLLQFGLTGRHVEAHEFHTKVLGDIEPDRFIEKLVPIYGIPQTLSDYTLNTLENKLIKAALTKILQFGVADLGKHPQHLRHFELVEDVFFDVADKDALVNWRFSANPWYPAALELAKKILFEVFSYGESGNIESISFLSNSNELFERYIRKVIRDGIAPAVEKWDRTEEFGELRQAGKAIGRKGYIPDILIEYNRSRREALAVIDVKNKVFSLSKTTSIDSVVSNPDIYQIYFYCKRLKAKIGGLVFPSSRHSAPIEIYLQDTQPEKIVLFAMNMRDSTKIRNEKLVAEVEREIIREL